MSFVQMKESPPASPQSGSRKTPALEQSLLRNAHHNNIDPAEVDVRARGSYASYFNDPFDENGHRSTMQARVSRFDGGAA